MPQSAIVVPYLPDGQMLMLRRGPTDPWRPGHWNFPGGKVDPGESAVQGAARELLEEAGIRVSVAGLAWKFSYRNQGRLIHVFLLPLRAKPVVRSMDGEHDAAMWVPWCRFPSPSIDAVKYICRQLTRS